MGVWRRPGEVTRPAERYNGVARRGVLAVTQTITATYEGGVLKPIVGFRG